MGQKCREGKARVDWGQIQEGRVEGDYKTKLSKGDYFI